MKPTTLTFESLTYRTDKKHRVILNDCTGSVRPGEVLAVLGPSGSGKSTLLDHLADRRKAGVTQTSGRVSFNGKELNKDQRRKLISFVGQDDFLYSCFTVRETLQTVTRFRFGLSMSAKEVNRRIESVMKDMGLLSVADVRVGDSVVGRKGLSGGQRRRLSIAIELISSSPILLLDEITSGLDFAAAYGVMKKVKHLANLRHSVVVIIHNPSSQIFNLLDRILLLADGKQVYIGNAARSNDYFRKLGYSCPPHYNQAEFLLTLVATDFALVAASVGALAADAKQIKDLGDAFQSSQEKQAELERIAIAVSTTNVGSLALADAPASEATTFAAEEPHAQRMMKSTLFEQTVVLLRRSFVNMFRNPNLFAYRILMGMVGVMLGLIFFEVGDQLDDPGISATVASQFAVTIFCSFMAIMVLPTMLNDRAVVLRERASEMYTTLPFALSILLNSVMITIVISCIVTVITYYMIGYQCNFPKLLFGMWTIMFFVEVYIDLVSVLVNNHIAAIITVLGYIASGVMVQGFFMKFDRISWIIRWLGYVTPQRFVFRALLRNEYEGRENFTNALLYPNGKAVIHHYFLDENGLSSYEEEIGFSWIFILVNMLILCLVLRRYY